MIRLAMVMVTLSACLTYFSSVSTAQESAFEVDTRSAHMGAIGAFAEMVRLDVKTLGLGTPVSTQEMNVILPTVKAIIERNGVQYYRETDFLVTDLYPASVTDGQEVIFIYKGDTLQQYLALKREKKHLIETGVYDMEARQEIASRFGKLLSYPDHTVQKLMSETH